MVNNNELKLGMHITFTRAYSAKSKVRLKGWSGKEAIPLGTTQDGAISTGIVVSKRSYIMSNWYRDSDSEAGCWIDGKKRGMLLVATHLYRGFVLVAQEDADSAAGEEETCSNSTM